MGGCEVGWVSDRYTNMISGCEGPTMALRVSLIRVGIWPYPRSLQDPVWPQLTPFFFSLLPGAAGRNGEGHAQRRGCGTQCRGRPTLRSDT